MNISNVTFGIEIETTVPATSGLSIGQYHHGISVASAATPVGLLVNAPTFAGKSWTAERDGSIRINNLQQRACEFVSPVLRGESGIDHALEFTAFLRSIGASVNDSCGLHIHVGVDSIVPFEQRAEFVRNLSRLVSQHSTSLYAQTGSIRRESGTYCQPIGQSARKQITDACRKNKPTEAMHCRYHILNLCNLAEKGTVEFRCFGCFDGTLNADKILLHLFTVLTLCARAVHSRNGAPKKSAPQWEERSKEMTGQRAVFAALRSPNFRFADAPIFHRRKKAMKKIAMAMADKYDQAKAARFNPYAPAH